LDITEEIIEAIDNWQNDPSCHQLTCGNNSNHKPLVIVKEESGKIFLKCMNCDYKQDHVPESIKNWWNEKSEVNHKDSNKLVWNKL